MTFFYYKSFFFFKFAIIRFCFLFNNLTIYRNWINLISTSNLIWKNDNIRYFWQITKFNNLRIVKNKFSQIRKLYRKRLKYNRILFHFELHFNKFFLFNNFYKKQIVYNKKKIILNFKQFLFNYFLTIYNPILYKNWHFLIGNLISPFYWNWINQKKWNIDKLSFVTYKNRRMFLNKNKTKTKAKRFNKKNFKFWWKFQRKKNFSKFIKKLFLNNFFYLTKLNVTFKNWKILFRMKMRKSNKTSLNWYATKPYLIFNNRLRSSQTYANYHLITLYKKYRKFFSLIKKLRLRFWFRRDVIFTHYLFKKKKIFSSGFRRYGRNEHFFYFKRNSFFYFKKFKKFQLMSLILKKKKKKKLVKKLWNCKLYKRNKLRARFLWTFLIRTKTKPKKNMRRSFVKRIRSRNRFKFKFHRWRLRFTRKTYKARLRKTYKTKIIKFMTMRKLYKNIDQTWKLFFKFLKRHRLKKINLFYGTKKLIKSNKTFFFYKKFKKTTIKKNILFSQKFFFPSSIFNTYVNQHQRLWEKKNKMFFLINYKNKLNKITSSFQFNLSKLYTKFHHQIFFSKNKTPFRLSRYGFIFMSEELVNHADIYSWISLRKHIYSFSYKNELQKYVLKRYTKRFGIDDSALSIKTLSLLKLNSDTLQQFKSIKTKNFFFDWSYLSLKTTSQVAHLLFFESLATDNSFINQQLEYWKNFSHDEWNDINIKRIRFKPGYSTLWRNARQALKLAWNLKMRYQYKLTNYVAQYNKHVRMRTYLALEMQLTNILIKTRLLPDLNSITLFLQNDLIFINGRACQLPNMLLALGDFVQLVISLKYYIMYKWLLNWELKKKNHLKKLAWKKARARFHSDEKQRSTHLPKWILFNKNSFGDVAKYLEVDYFTLSIIVIYEPFLWTDLNFYNFTTIKFGVINLYNWKYIT